MRLKYWCCLIIVGLVVVVAVGCSSAESPQSEPVSVQAREVVLAVGEQYDYELLKLAADAERAELVRHELRSLRWEAEPPMNSSDTQTLVYDDLQLKITGKHSELIKRLGQQYVDGEIDAATYQNSMGMLAAMTDGVLRSHALIHDREVSQLNSALPYAALLRASISSELREHGFEGAAVLTEEQQGMLRDAARTGEYEKFDQLP